MAPRWAERERAGPQKGGCGANEPVASAFLKGSRPSPLLTLACYTASVDQWSPTDCRRRATKTARRLKIFMRPPVATVHRAPSSSAFVGLGLIAPVNADGRYLLFRAACHSEQARVLARSPP
jgi:hypothetical protein